MKAGEGLRFQRDHDFTEAHRLRYGTQARDEMWNLFGLAWDAGGERTMPYQGCAITWIDDRGVGKPRAPGAAFPRRNRSWRTCVSRAQWLRGAP